MSKPVSRQHVDHALLHDEYATFAKEAGVILGEPVTPTAESTLVGKLIVSGDWSRESAMELVYLAKRYGHFFLRNATALASALGVEDGQIGY